MLNPRPFARLVMVVAKGIDNLIVSFGSEFLHCHFAIRPVQPKRRARAQLVSIHLGFDDVKGYADFAPGPASAANDEAVSDPIGSDCPGNVRAGQQPEISPGAVVMEPGKLVAGLLAHSVLRH